MLTDRPFTPKHQGYDVLDGDGYYVTTVIVLARDDAGNVYFKDWLKPLNWGKLNRMRALRPWEFRWLVDSERWKPVPLSPKQFTYLGRRTWLSLNYATQEWFLARPNQTESH